ncbi:MAG: site-specific integrase [Alistipes sp.]|nr:site-specific integrase [Alistipes sp.]
MKYTCNFLLEKRKDKEGNLITKNVPICADICFKQRLRYPTGYRVDVERWVDTEATDPDTGEIVRVQRVKKNSYGTKDKKPVAYNFINNDLKLIQATLFELFRDNDTVTKELIISTLDNKIKKTKNRTSKEIEVDTSLWGLFSTFTKEPSVSEGRRKTYLNAYNNLKNFEKARRRKIDFVDCTPRLMAEFDEFMKTDDNSSGKYDHLPLRQRPRPKGRNTRVKVFRTLSTFFKWVNKNYNITVNPFAVFKIESEQYDTPICLTKEERDLLYDFTPSKPYLERTRDLFYFQCCVGCRVSDFFNLTKDNLKNDGTLLEYIPQKTINESTKVCRIPLTEKAQAILLKYDMPDGKLLPFISPQKYNDYIGELLQEAAIDRTVTVVDKVTMKPQIKPLYEFITSHSCRKTFIDILMKSGISESVISSMSGHVKGSKAFHRYYEVDDIQRMKAINEIY